MTKQLAKANAKALAAIMNDAGVGKWEAHVWENLDWHYSVRQVQNIPNVEIMPNLLGGYIAYIHTEVGTFTGTHKEATKAFASAGKALKNQIDDLKADYTRIFT